MTSYNWYLVFWSRKSVILRFLINVRIKRAWQLAFIKLNQYSFIVRSIHGAKTQDTNSWIGTEKDWLALSSHSNGQRHRGCCTVTVKRYPVGKYISAFDCLFSAFTFTKLKMLMVNSLKRSRMRIRHQLKNSMKYRNYYKWTVVKD